MNQNKNCRNHHLAILSSILKRRMRISFWKSLTLRLKNTELKQSQLQVPRSHKEETNGTISWFERRSLWKRTSIYSRRWNWHPLNDLTISLNLCLNECNSCKMTKTYSERKCSKKYLTFEEFWKELTIESMG